MVESKIINFSKLNTFQFCTFSSIHVVSVPSQMVIYYDNRIYNIYHLRNSSPGAYKNVTCEGNPFLKKMVPVIVLSLVFVSFNSHKLPGSDVLLFLYSNIRSKHERKI